MKIMTLRPLRLCGALVCIASLCFTFLPSNASADQLLPNTGFETWSEVFGVLMPDGWYTTALLDPSSAERSTNAHQGSYSLKLSQQGFVFGSFSNDDFIPVLGNNPYDFSIWTKNILSAGILWFIQYNADTSIAFDTLLIPLSFGWNQVNTTIITEPEAITMAVGATVLFGTIYFDDATLDGNPVGVEEPESGEFRTPNSAFVLFQNQPNPFNSSTLIRYSLSVVGAYGNTPVQGSGIIGEGKLSVMLAIYDITGRLVKTLVDKRQEPGIYSFFWDGRNGLGEELSSGMYFYQLKSGEIIDTKSMILMK